jgi:hypothetical protein
MNETVKIAIESLGVRETLDLGADIAAAPLQQREAMIERVCQAILTQSGSPRAGNPG